MKPVILLALGLAAAAPAAFAEHASAPAAERQCFYVRQVENFTVTPDERTLYLRVNGTRFFRLDLAEPCTGLTFQDHISLQSFGGLSSVCTPLDIDLRVREPHMTPRQCTVTAMHALAPDEVAALPKKLKP